MVGIVAVFRPIAENCVTPVGPMVNIIMVIMVSVRYIPMFIPILIARIIMVIMIRMRCIPVITPIIMGRISVVPSIHMGNIVMVIMVGMIIRMVIPVCVCHIAMVIMVLVRYIYMRYIVVVIPVLMQSVRVVSMIDIRGVGVRRVIVITPVGMSSAIVVVAMVGVGIIVVAPNSIIGVGSSILVIGSILMSLVLVVGVVRMARIDMVAMLNVSFLSQLVDDPGIILHPDAPDHPRREIRGGGHGDQALIPALIYISESGSLYPEGSFNPGNRAAEDTLDGIFPVTPEKMKLGSFNPKAPC